MFLNPVVCFIIIISDIQSSPGKLYCLLSLEMSRSYFNSYWLVFFLYSICYRFDVRCIYYNVKIIILVGRFDGVYRHFQQYFSYIVAVSFIGEGNPKSTHTEDNIRYQSWDVIYPVLKGSCFGKPNLLIKPLPFKTGYITSRDK